MALWDTQTQTVSIATVIDEINARVYCSGWFLYIKAANYYTLVMGIVVVEMMIVRPWVNNITYHFNTHTGGILK